MKNYTKVNLTSSDLSLEKQEELRRILPEAFSEDKIDWEKLRTVLGDSVDERIEKFNFSWAGKSDAIKSVLIPSKGTLRADKDESIKFDESENIFIEGDNLEVLKLLQKAYFEKVKMIYIDPPYNTGGDFVYRDNFTAPLKGYLQQTGQVDGEGNGLQTNKETNGRFHSDWLSMMYPRLKLAWNLLRDDGMVFVSIDDNEAHHLRMVMDEIFGEENNVGQFIWHKKLTGGYDNDHLNIQHEYVLFYAKQKEKLVVIGEQKESKYKLVDENGKKYKWDSLWNVGGLTYSKSLDYAIVAPDGSEIWPSGERGISFWLWSKDKVEKERGHLKFEKDKSGKWKVYKRVYASESIVPGSMLDKEIVKGNTHSSSEIKKLFGGDKIFDYAKPTTLVRYLLSRATEGNDIILDFFAGSATTAHSVLKQNQEDGGNRKFILVQLPEAIGVESEAYKAGYENIANISKERIRRVINGYGENPQPIDAGFKVFKLGESNYPENQFEFDPEKSEEENKKAFDEYLSKAKQVSLFDEVNVSDVIYENIVKEGFSLNAKIAVSKIAENTMSIVSDGEMQFLICLDKKINDEAIRALTEAEYKGKTFICFDSALDDTAKANLGLNIELKTI